MKWESLPDEIDLTGDVRLLYDFYLNKSVDKSKALLAGLNVIGYVGGRAWGPIPMGSSMTTKEGTELFEQALAPQSVGKLGDGTLLKRLLPIILQLLPLLFL